MKRLLKLGVIVIGGLFVIITALGVIIAATGDDDENRSITPEPIVTKIATMEVATKVVSSVRRGLTADIKAVAVLTATQIPEVLDAALRQDGDDISLVLIVVPQTDKSTAMALGERFVRNVKALSKDTPPGRTVGRGRYNYLIIVAYPSEKTVAQGAKSKTRDTISW